jgi:hypothetical protein
VPKRPEYSRARRRSGDFAYTLLFDESETLRVEPKIDVRT